MVCPISSKIHPCKGFTLVELLVVVMVVAVLSGLVITIVNPARLNGKARDSQRAQNLKTISNALELYRAKNGFYPQVDSGCTSTGVWVELVGTDCISTDLTDTTSGVLGSIPADPLPSNFASTPNPCTYINASTSAPDYRMQYGSDAAGSYYFLTTQMETLSSVSSSALCSSLPNFSGAQGCVGANPNCYGVANKIL